MLMRKVDDDKDILMARELCVRSWRRKRKEAVAKSWKSDHGCRGGGGSLWRSTKAEAW